MVTATAPWTEHPSLPPPYIVHTIIHSTYTAVTLFAAHFGLSCLAHASPMPCTLEGLACRTGWFPRSFISLCKYVFPSSKFDREPPCDDMMGNFHFQAFLASHKSILSSTTVQYLTRTVPHRTVPIVRTNHASVSSSQLLLLLLLLLLLRRRDAVIVMSNYTLRGAERPAEAKTSGTRPSNLIRKNHANPQRLPASFFWFDTVQ